MTGADDSKMEESLVSDEIAMQGGWQPSRDASPISGFTPSLTSMSPEERDEMLRYGRLRHISPHGHELAVDLPETLRAYGNLFSHSRVGPVSRYLEKFNLTQDEVRELAEVAKEQIRRFWEDNRIILLAYSQYQGNLAGNEEAREYRKSWSGRGLIENWQAYLDEWEHLIPRAAWDRVENLLGRTANNYRAGLAGRTAHATNASLMGRGNFFGLDAPITLLRAKASVAIQLAAGAAGCYFDCGAYGQPDTDYSPYAVRNYRAWLKENLSEAEAAELIGEPLDTVEPPLMPPAAQLLPRNVLTTTDELDDALIAPASDRHLDARTIAFLRRRRERVAWFLREVRKYGESIHPGYTSASTYYVDDSGPHFYALFMGYTAENMVQGGRANSFLLWEPWANMPHRGMAKDDARDASTWLPFAVEKKVDPYIDPSVYGRRSNSAFLKYLDASVSPATSVAKYWPLPYFSALGEPSADRGGKTLRPVDKGNGNIAVLEHLIRLSFAECWSNHYCFRAQQWGGKRDWDFIPFAAKQMNGFQANHEKLFLGAERMDRVGVLCSLQQSDLMRYDNSLAVSRMLTDTNIEHRILLDRHVDEADFGDLRCIVLANVRSLSDRQIANLNRFARRDGCGLVLIGRVGDRDLWDRERPEARDLLGRDVPPGQWADLGLETYPRLPHTGSYQIAGQGDDPADLARAVAQVHGPDFAVLAAPSPFVEIHPLFIPAARSEDNIPRVVVHVVNYDVDLTACRITPISPFELKVRIPENHQLKEARIHDPMQATIDEPGQPMQAGIEQEHGADYAVFHMPETMGSAIIAMELKPVTETGGKRS